MGVRLVRNMKDEKKCPTCGSDDMKYPALSRRDNETKICSKCGTAEALEDFANRKKNEKIELPLSEEDCYDLLNGKTFEWTFPTDKGRDIDLVIGLED